LTETNILMSPFTGAVTSFSLSNPVDLSASGSTHLGSNTLTLVIGGKTYTDTLTETKNPYYGVVEVGLLKGSGLPTAGLESELDISFTQAGGRGNVISGSATFIAQTSTIPEPSTWAMLALGFMGLGYAASRRNARNRAVTSI
jgi:PEP-CTERM motif